MKAVLGFPNASVIAPAGMFTVKVPEKMLVKFKVNSAVVFQLMTWTFVTVVPGTPLRCRSVVCTEVGSTASLKFTSYVYVAGPGGLECATNGRDGVSYR